MRQIVLVHNQLLQVGIPESPRYHLAYPVFAVQERTWWLVRHGSVSAHGHAPIDFVGLL